MRHQIGLAERHPSTVPIATGASSRSPRDNGRGGGHARCVRAGRLGSEPDSTTSRRCCSRTSSGEEQVCFPETDRLAGTPWATQLLRHQHEQIRRHLGQLRADGLDRVEPHQRAVLELPAHLYVLRAFVTSHLSRRSTCS